MSVVKLKRVSKILDSSTNTSLPQNKKTIKKSSIFITLLLFISFAGLFYQYYKIDVLNAQLEETAIALSEEKSRCETQAALAIKYTNLYGSLQNEHRGLTNRYKQLTNEFYNFRKTYFIPYIEWEHYKDNFACVVSVNGNCAYHLPYCYHLGDTFYGFTVKEAENKGCWPCSDCHDSSHYWRGPKSESEHQIFNNYFN